MPPSRAALPNLLLAVLCIAVSLVLLGPLSVSAQVTHSGKFALTTAQSQFAPYKAPQPETLVLTICVDSGSDPVQVLADGAVVPTLGSVDDHGCRTRRIVAEKITIGLAAGAGSSTGTYSLSLSLQ
jgi:hypothetical protein